MEESPVEQARKYVEKKKGWRPERRTVMYLAFMAAALALSAVLVPRLLPGSIPDGKVLLGRDGGVATLSVGGGAPDMFVEKPPRGETFTAWSMSPTRDEVALGWSGRADGGGVQAKVQVRSAFSGRVQTEWSLGGEGNDASVTQLGYLPQHNQIWLISAGRMYLIDIKSAEILDFPFKGPGGKGEVEVPREILRAGFSPEKGLLALAEPDRLTVVRGLAFSRDKEPLGAEVVLDLRDATDTEGRPVRGGAIGAFTWLDDERLLVSVEPLTVLELDRPSPSALYVLKVPVKGRAKARLIVGPEEGISYLDVSRSPADDSFAVLVSGRKRLAVREYDPSGRRIWDTNLPDAEWSPPLIWTSP